MLLSVTLFNTFNHLLHCLTVGCLTFSGTYYVILDYGALLSYFRRLKNGKCKHAMNCYKMPALKNISVYTLNRSVLVSSLFKSFKRCLVQNISKSAIEIHNKSMIIFFIAIPNYVHMSFYIIGFIDLFDIDMYTYI